jgi:predicted nuclease with TOPRIM domain
MAAPPCLDESEVRNLINEILSQNAVFKQYCDERHKEVAKLSQLLEKLESKINQFYTILIMTLTSVVINLALLIFQKV